MARYIYTAKSEPNIATQGNIEADSKQEAINKLAKMGYFPLSLESEEASLAKDKGLRLWKIPRKDILLFTRQLYTLINSNVNILKSLTIISNQAPNKYLRSTINEIYEKIKNGQPLSEALSAYKNLFSDLYIAIIRAGETSGNLNTALKRLADFSEKEEEFRNSVRAALIYPFFIFAVGALTVTILLTFVIPRLVTMFEDMGQVLPLPTKILIGISGFMRSWWWVILGAVFVFIFLLKRASGNPQGKYFLDRLKLKTPIFGKIFLKTDLAHMVRSLSLLLSSGITVISALDISTSVIANTILKDELGKIKEEVSKGASLSGCLQNSTLFPPFVTNIISVGEETGTLEVSLLHIAEDYERETDRYLKTLTQLLEPVMIFVMGIVIGFIVLSMLLPIFQINLVVK